MSRPKATFEDFTEDAGAIIGIVLVTLLAGIFILAAWAVLIGGLVWGIWMTATTGPAFWPIAVIIVCGSLLAVDIGRRVLR